MESITVDFGDGSGERVVYFKKRNLDQIDKVLKAKEDGAVEFHVVTLLTRALTEHGSLMFTKLDRSRVRKDFDVGAVFSVVEAIRKFDEEVEAPGK